MTSPCFANTRFASFATASSAAPRNVGSASRTSCPSPRRRQTLPISSPITPGADDAEPLRHVRNRERAGVVEHAHVVERHARQRTRRRARRDDHVRRGERCGLRALDGDVPAGLEAASAERAAAVEERHLVLLEEVQDAVVVLRDDLLLARQHPRDVDREAADLYAVVGEARAPHARSARTIAAAPSTECTRHWCTCRPAQACRRRVSSRRYRPCGSRAVRCGSRRCSRRGRRR